MNAIEHLFSGGSLVIAVLSAIAAYATGRAMAGTWRSFAQALFYMVLLAFATRFFHFALNAGDLLSGPSLIVDFVILVVATAAGYRIRRMQQMATQYSFLDRKG